MDIIGTLIEKGGIKEVNDNLNKREFVIKVPDPKGNPKWDQEYTFQLINKNCPLIDNWSLDDEIKVYFDIRGRRYNGKGYHDLSAWKIEGIKYSKPVENKASSAPEYKQIVDNSGEDDLPF